MIVSQNNQQRSVNFGSAWSSSQEKLAKKTTKTILNLLGHGEGDTVMIINTPSLPSKASEDTGVGNLFSKLTDKMLELFDTYAGATIIKELPIGENRSHHNKLGFYCNYTATSLSYGSQNINLQKLTEKEYGNILPKEDFQELVNSNKKTHKDNWVNYENESASRNNKPILDKLRIAFDNFKKQDTPEVQSLKKEHDKYVEKEAENLKLNAPKNDEEFYNFWQFIAHKHHQAGKEQVNAKGQDLTGDCLAGFSDEEKLAFPEAFIENATFGTPNWSLNALDFNKIYNEDGSLGPAGKMLKKKAKFFFERYDRVRFDVGWGYASPHVADKGNKKQIHFKDYVSAPEGPHTNNSIFKIIEDTAKEVYGDKYHPNRISYEAEGDKDMYKPFMWNGPGIQEQQPAMKGIMKIFKSDHENIKDGHGWGSADFFKNYTKLTDDEYMLGTSNHDSVSLREIAENPEFKERKQEAMLALQKSLGIPKEKLEDPKELVKAKFSEPYLVKNRLMFINDFFGRAETIDKQNTDINNYRTRYTEDFEKEFHTALQKGHGFNLMESLTIAMKAEKLDKSHPEIYKTAKKLGEILREKGALTKAEADAIEQKAKDKKEKKTNILGIIMGVIGAGIAGGSSVSLAKNYYKDDKEPIKQVTPIRLAKSYPVSKHSTFNQFQ